MFYTIYQTTNLTNGKIYIGYHSTEDLNDQYLGSGKILKQAIDRVGVENFKREILYVFPTKEEALQKEREIVNEEFLQRDGVYNIKLGGEGGWDHTHNDPIIKQKRLNGIAQSFQDNVSRGWQLTDSQRSEIGKKAFLGKKHTEEAKKKIGEAKKMDETILNQRIKDYEATPKKYGYISKLARQWNISHTQVRRFLKQNNLD
jgi:group I intron endonuclease